MSNEAAEEYASSLSDLTINSKPMISMLTMLAEDNVEHAAAIAQVVESHLHKVKAEHKLPTLYLIDSIVKNVNRDYTTLFSQNIVSSFCSVFEKADEKTRAQMFKLRQTWNDVFPVKKLYALDVQVHTIDPGWPITAQCPISSIHVNPKFLEKSPPPALRASAEIIKTSKMLPLPAILPISLTATATTSKLVTSKPVVSSPAPPKVKSSTSTKFRKKEVELQAARDAELKQILLRKQKEYLELQQKRIELELLQAKLEMEQKQNDAHILLAKGDIQCVRVCFEFGHHASLRAKETPEGFTHDWQVFVQGEEGADIVHFVEKVIFYLQGNYPKPKRVVKEPPFLLRECGSSGFLLPIEIYFKSKEEPKTYLYDYNLELQNSGPPVKKLVRQTYTFTNPSEEFRRRLIRGGGIQINVGLDGPGPPRIEKPVLDESIIISSPTSSSIIKPKLGGGEINKKDKLEDKKSIADDGLQSNKKETVPHLTLSRNVVPEKASISIVPVQDMKPTKKSSETISVSSVGQSNRGSITSSRLRDPRLASRQSQTEKPTLETKQEPLVTSGDVNILETEKVPEANISYINNVNKEYKGVSRKDPRLKTNKVLNVGNVGSKEQTLFENVEDVKITDDVKKSPSPIPTQPRKIYPVSYMHFKSDEDKSATLSSKVNIPDTSTSSQSYKVGNSAKRNLDKRKDKFHSKTSNSKSKKRYSPSRRKSPPPSHDYVSNKDKIPQKAKSSVFKSRLPGKHQRSRSPGFKTRHESSQHKFKSRHPDSPERSKSPQFKPKYPESPKRSRSPILKSKLPEIPKHSSVMAKTTMQNSKSVASVSNEMTEKLPVEIPDSPTVMNSSNESKSSCSPSKKKNSDTPKGPAQKRKGKSPNKSKKRKADDKQNKHESFRYSQSPVRSPPSSPFTDTTLKDTTPEEAPSLRENAERKSPEVETIPSTGDVDLRTGIPPPKLRRLSFQSDTTVPTSSSLPKEDVKNPIVDATKDVDFRQLTSSPGKKRSSVEPEDEPAPKKNKPEVFDELFGKEDVDLRKLQPPVVMKSTTPPPVISHPLTPPVVEPSQNANRTAEHDTPEVFEERNHSNDNMSRNNRLQSWAMYKETLPNAYGPLRGDAGRKSVGSLIDSPSPTMHRESAFNISQKESPLLDRLGRPLLYNRLPDDPEERKRSLNDPLGSGDTDMRRLNLFEREKEIVDQNFNFDMIMSQAEEQLRNGTITPSYYNTLLKQVIHLNEVYKLQEAQRKERELRRSRRNRREIEKYDRSPYSPLSDISDSAEVFDEPVISKENSRAGDVDERFAVDSQFRIQPKSSQTPPRDENVPVSSSFAAQLPRLDQSDPSTVVPDRRPPPPWHNVGSGPPRLPHPSMSVAPPPLQHPLSSEYPGPSTFGLNRWRTPLPVQNRPILEPDIPNENRLENILQELPCADPKLLEVIAQDSMKTINIDGIPQEIRFYGDAAVVLLDWDNPREISFQSGMRRVIFNEKDAVIVELNKPYKNFILNDQTHRIRFGAPTREIYIDGKWYECSFGGPPIKVEVGGRLHSLKIEGPAPQVKIGNVKRTDLVAGKITLIIDAKVRVPMFLDAKPQRVDISGKAHVIQFINALEGVLINGVPRSVRFGGIPEPIIVGRKKHYIRFSTLPRNVRPGLVNIINMIRITSLSSPHPKEEYDVHVNRNEQKNMFNRMGPLLEPPPKQNIKRHEKHEPALPVTGLLGDRPKNIRPANKLQGMDEADVKKSPSHASSEQSSSSLQDFQMFKNKPTGQLEMLASLMPTTLAPASSSSYQVERESEVKKEDSKIFNEDSQSGDIPLLSLPVNVSELFKKLVATGIVPHIGSAGIEIKKDDESKIIKQVDLKNPETLKYRQGGLISLLYSGIQCSSCGVRFSPEQTVKYSQHLDWHFRQNRRDRDNTRKAQSRKWHYDVSDWIQFEEIEDLEERAQSWFETQMTTESGQEDKEEEEVQSVPAGNDQEDIICVVCHDKFEQFYNEESEEWHLRHAVRIDGNTYHPVCYADYQASLNSSLEESKAEESDEKPHVKEESIDDETKVEENTTIDSEATKEDSNQEADTKNEVAADAIKQEPKEESEVTEGEKIEVTEGEKSEVTEGEKIEVTEGEKIEVTEGEKSENVRNDEENSEKNNADNTEIEEKLNELSVKEEPVEKDTVEEEIKVKEEQMEEENIIEQPPSVDTTHAEVACSIDGNVQFDEASQPNIASGPAKIKINIIKPVTTKDQQEESETTANTEETKSEEVNVKSEEVTIETEDKGSEESVETVPELEPASIKPAISGRKLVVCPPVDKGHELSGLCSIM